MELRVRWAPAGAWAVGAAAALEGAAVAAAAREVSANVTARAIAYSLLTAAVVLALLMLAWIGVSGARGGGIILGLILLVVLAGPLGIAGIVVLQRQPVEAAAEAEFANKRRILESDRLFRNEIAPELRQLAARPGLPAQRLTELAADLERSSYDSADWYDAVQLGNDDIDMLKRYDDLVWERVRSLRDKADGGASTAELKSAVDELQQALDQRRDLLIRGRRAPAAAPSVLLRAGAPAHGQEAISTLQLGDAITQPEGTDSIAEGIATYFAEGQTWKMVHLVPPDARSKERWLYIGPAGLDLAMLDEVAAPAAGQGLAFQGKELPRLGVLSATVDVKSHAGSAEAVLVTITRYGSHDVLGLVENWPDGTRHAYIGNSIRASDLEVWPATVRPGINS
jgi:hypothetical protein